MDEDQRTKYGEKIAKLLRKAESTTPEEAEALFEKAQELMMTWAIDEEFLAQLRGDKPVEKIVRESIRYTGSYHPALWEIGATIARNNNCRVLIAKLGNASSLVIIGFESDVERVKLLNASMQIQAARAQSNWWKTIKSQMQYYSASEKFKARRDFLFGFASGLGMQLSRANKEAEKQAAENQTLRVNISQEEAVKSVALVVRTKKQKVDDWVDQEYGKLRSARGGNYARSWSSGAYGKGVSAGSVADTNRPRVGSAARKALA